MEEIVEIVVPIFVCVVLPVACVWLVMNERKHRIDRQTEIALKAIEKGVMPDLDMDIFSGSNKSVKKAVFRRLTTAIILTAIGVIFLLMGIFMPDTDGNTAPVIVMLSVGAAFFLIYFLSRRHYSDEIAAEESALKEKKAASAMKYATEKSDTQNDTCGTTESETKEV